MTPEQPPEVVLSYQRRWFVFVDYIFASSRSHQLVRSQDDVGII